MAWLIVATAALCAAWVSLVPSLVLTVAGCVLLRRWKAVRRVSAHTRQRTRDVSALRALTAELRSGLPPAEALQAASGSGGSGGSGGQADRQVGGIAARMVAAAAAEGLGGDAAIVLSQGAEPGSPEAALGAAWTVCQRTGARLAAPVSRIADGAAANLRTASEADTALAGARSSAHLLAALPLAGIGLGSLSGTGSLNVLFNTGFGQLCLAIGVALDLAGLAWLDRLAAGHA